METFIFFLSSSSVFFSFGSFSLQCKHNLGNVMGQCSSADRLLMKDSAGQPPPPSHHEVYKAFWRGQCRWANRLLVKDNAGQPPPKKIQGVLDRAM